MPTPKDDKQKTNVETVTEDTAKKVTPNTVKTQEDFAQTNILEALALNSELTTLNKGELRFKVVKKDVYEFDKTDKDGKPQVDEFGQVIKIKSPYAEIVAEGVNSKLSTKKLSKDEIEHLQIGCEYIGTYILNGDMGVTFTSIVPFKQELLARLKHLNTGS